MSLPHCLVGWSAVYDETFLGITYLLFHIYLYIWSYLAPFWDLDLPIIWDSLILNFDKRDDFNFEIVKFLFHDRDVSRSTSYGIYISQLIRFARVCSTISVLNNRNQFLTAKLLKNGYRYLLICPVKVHLSVNQVLLNCDMI